MVEYVLEDLLRCLVLFAELPRSYERSLTGVDLLDEAFDRMIYGDIDCWMAALEGHRYTPRLLWQLMQNSRKIAVVNITHNINRTTYLARI
jgi:hypothetical protein